MQKARFSLLFILIISLFPAMCGWYLYHYRTHFQLKTLNQGTLINPVIQFDDLKAKNNSSPLWQIIYVPHSCCHVECQKIMFTLHQLRLVLGKDSKRVGLTLVTDKACKKTDTHDFNTITFDHHHYSTLQSLFDRQKHHASVDNKIYLMDPRGNLFIYYESTDDAMHILKDLQRVLEVSQIG